MQIILNKYWEDRWIKAGVHGGNGWATKATNHVDLPNQSEQTLNENESQGFKKQNTELQWTRFPPLEQNTNLKTKCCRRQYISIKISESFLLPFPSLWDPMFISKQGHYTPPTPRVVSAIRVCRPLEALLDSASQTSWTAFLTRYIKMQILI